MLMPFVSPSSVMQPSMHCQGPGLDMQEFIWQHTQELFNQCMMLLSGMNIQMKGMNIQMEALRQNQSALKRMVDQHEFVLSRPPLPAIMTLPPQQMFASPSTPVMMGMAPQQRFSGLIPERPIMMPRLTMSARRPSLGNPEPLRGSPAPGQEEERLSFISNGDPEDLVDVFLNDFVKGRQDLNLKVAKLDSPLYTLNGQEACIIEKDGIVVIQDGTEWKPFLDFIDEATSSQPEERPEPTLAAPKAGAMPKAKAGRKPKAKAAAKAKTKAHSFGSDGMGIAQDSSRDPVEKMKLFEACAEGNRKAVLKMVKEYGPQCLHDSNKEGFTPLAFAAQNGHVDVVMVLLLMQADQGVGLVSKRLKILDENTVLHLAVEKGHALVVSEILRICGQSLLALTNKVDNTPFHLAAGSDCVDVLRAIYDQAEATWQKKVLDKKGQFGFQPIHFAAESGDVDVIDQIIQWGGVDELWKRTDNDSSPFHLAVMCDNVKAMRAMFTKNGMRLLEQRGPDGYYAVHLAAWQGHVDAAKQLLEWGGADELKKVNKGKSPLDLAQTDEMRTLLRGYE